jgi:hypothetical protein
MTLPDRLRILSHGAANDTVAVDILAIADEFDRLRSDHDAAIALLWELGLELTFSGQFCRACRGYPYGGGHKPDCKLDALLGTYTEPA